MTPRNRRFVSLLFSSAACLLSANAGRADIKFVILENEANPGGFFLNQGHSVTYVTGLCPDGPTKVRKCREGEQDGIVLNRFAGISKENYDWLVTRPTTFFAGVDKPEQAPLIGNRKMQELTQKSSFETQDFVKSIAKKEDGELQKGYWKTSIGNSYDRESYVFTLKTTPEQEQKLMDAMNSDKNKSSFNLLWRNCTDLPEDFFKLIFPDMTEISKIPGIGMNTPKGLAMDVVHYVQKHPELNLTISKIPQIPGTRKRSSDNLFPLENSYKSPLYSGLIKGFQPRPYTLGGTGAMAYLKYMSIGAFVLHQFVMHFAIPDEYKKYLNDDTRKLITDLEKARDDQDKVRAEVESAKFEGRTRDMFAALAKEREVNERLDRIKSDLKTAQEKVLGSPADWKSYEKKYADLVTALKARPDLPAEARKLLGDKTDPGAVSKAILKFFEDKGDFFLKDGHMHVRMKFAGETEMRVGGLTEPTVLDGDELLGTLTLLANTGYNLDAKAKDKNSRAEFETDWNLLVASMSRGSTASGVRALASDVEKLNHSAEVPAGSAESNVLKRATPAPANGGMEAMPTNSRALPAS